MSCHYIFQPYEYLLDESYIKYIPINYSTYNQNVDNKDISDDTKIEYFERSLIKN